MQYHCGNGVYIPLNYLYFICCSNWRKCWLNLIQPTFVDGHPKATWYRERFFEQMQQQNTVRWVTCLRVYLGLHGSCLLLGFFIHREMCCSCCLIFKDVEVVCQIDNQIKSHCQYKEITRELIHVSEKKLPAEKKDVNFWNSIKTVSENGTGFMQKALALSFCG